MEHLVYFKLVSRQFAGDNYPQNNFPSNNFPSNIGKMEIVKKAPQINNETFK